MLPKIKSRWFNSTLINLHAPTNDNSEEVKNEFYDNLEQVVDKLNNYVIKVLPGDCNAKIGKEPIFSPTIGLESLHEKSNYNATCLIQFSTLKGMNIRSTTISTQISIKKPGTHQMVTQLVKSIMF